MMARSTDYDAIVVGSGISGGWAAKELTEKGLRVLLLERGRNVEHIKDYVNATKAPWEYPASRRAHARRWRRRTRVLKRDYPLNEKNLDFWVNDKESPYTEVKRFDWYRGYQVGGRSLMWGRQSYRWSDFDFEANAKEGIAIDWPIRYADIAPWYDHVEKHAGISGSREGLPQLPDGQFQPAMPLNCGEELVAGRLQKRFDGRRRHHSRAARRTPRRRCPAARPASTATPAGSAARTARYFSTQSSTLPAAHEDRPPHAQALVDRDRGAATTRTASARPACASSMPSASRRPTTARRSSSSARPRSTRRGC